MTNGAEGFVDPGQTAYLQLWSIEDVPRLNAAYEVGHFAPGILIFGSSGGGTAYAFDLRQPHLPVLEVEFIPMALSEAHELAPTFTEFLELLARQSP